MWVIDEITKQEIEANESIKVVVKHIPGCIIYGFIEDTRNNREGCDSVLFYVDGMFKSRIAYLPLLSKENLVFNTQLGAYMSVIDVPYDMLITNTTILGSGNFPYNFAREYEAIDNFHIFNGRQKVLWSREYELAKHMPYTFGLEFETSAGYIPENICYRDGLIPLRDGSINGLEYSTVILQGNDGINLLKQQLDTLKEYTIFNKECSLHIHIGGFKLDPDVIFRIYYLYRVLEPYIEDLVPPLTFKSNEYKANGKNYCKKVPLFKNFDHLYKSLVGRPYLGSLTQPHPKDLERARKWNVNTRYYALNLINAICYDVNKTIEFRFLRPTYNFNKILIWLYIFNAIIKYAETESDLTMYYHINTDLLMQRVYPEPIADEICKEIKYLYIQTRNQIINNDMCGQDLSLEDKLFTQNLNL